VYAKIQESKITSTKSTWTKIKTSDMKQMADGNWYAWTGTEWVNTWAAWKETPKVSKYTAADWTVYMIDENNNTASPVMVEWRTAVKVWDDERWTKIEYINTYSTPLKWKTSTTSNLSNEEFFNEINSQVGIK